MRRLFSLILSFVVFSLVSVPAAEIRTLVVSNTEASGKGSFFDALTQVYELYDGKNNTEFKIDFDIDDVKDAVIEINQNLTIFPKSLYGYLTVDGTTYKGGTLTIKLGSRITCNGQRVSFEGLNFIYDHKTSSGSFRYNATATLGFVDCNFYGFGAYNIEDALFSNYESSGYSGTISFVKCTGCKFVDCPNVFKHTIEGSGGAKSKSIFIFNECELKKSKLSVWEEYYVDIEKCVFEESSLSVKKVERFVSLENLFLTASTDGKAYSYDEPLAKPEITVVNSGLYDRVVKGFVDLDIIKGNELVEGKPVSVDIYYTDKGENTSTLFLGNAVCDENGEFELVVPYKVLASNKKLYLSACAVYDLDNNGPDVSSELSFYCEPENITSRDEILEGESFLGVIYNKMGIYKDIVESRKSEDGCEVVITHTLVVKPKATEYFVRTKAKGIGDGSDWDNAMSKEDFSFALTYAPAGSKFYIAEGEYQPMYDKKGEVPTNNYEKNFYTTKGVELYGGFPTSSVGKELNADPKNHPTVFSGDFRHDNPKEVVLENQYAEYRKDDAHQILRIEPEEDASIVISGIEFYGSYQHTRESSAACYIYNDGYKNKVDCRIDHCTFSDNENGLSVLDCSLEMADNRFIDNYYGGFSVYSSNKEEKVSIVNCTAAGRAYSAANITRALLTMSNNTLVGNTYLSNCGTLELYNNTIVGEFTIHATSDSKNIFVGNIFDGSVSAVNESEIISKHNIYLEEEDLDFISKSDLKVAASEIQYLFGGGLKVADNGGFTPTIALSQDRLSDKTTIRFVKTDTEVEEDQRGESRLKYTCAGAYETECMAVNTTDEKEIAVGEEFFGVVYDKVGTYEIEQTIKSAVECDSVVNYTLVVKPSKNRHEYYVKMERQGNGDGSTWEDAMSGEDFAYVLPTCDKGVTFHVAAGTYRPCYDAYGEFSDSGSGLTYNINTNVTIIGGYPADVLDMEALSEPSKYKTIFDGDPEKNDEEVLDESGDVSGCETYKSAYTEDNVNTLFSVNATLDGMNVSFNGVEFKKFNYAVYVSGAGVDANLSFDKVLFEKNYGTAVQSYVPGLLKITNSAFSKNNSCINTPMSVDLNNVNFEFNYGYNLVSCINSQNQYVEIETCNFNKNQGTITCGCPLSVKNSKFINACVDNIISVISSSDVAIENSTFENNNCENVFLGSNVNLSVEDCRFEGNNISTKCINTQNLLLKNTSFKENKAVNDFCDLIYASNHTEVSESIFDTNTFGNIVLGTGKETTLYGCTFLFNEASCLLKSNSGNKTIEECFFDKNKVSDLLDVSGSYNVKISKSTFSKNNTSNLFMVRAAGNANSEDSFVLIENSTIVSNTATVNLFDKYYSDISFFNNTIVGNDVSTMFGSSDAYTSNGKEVLFVGNIVFGNRYLEYSERNFLISDTKNNLIPLCVENGSVYLPGETNIVSDYYVSEYIEKGYESDFDLSKVVDMSVDIASLFDGEYDPSTGIFTPVIENHGGLVPTVALKSDKLPNGKNIRFSLRQTNVETDQRGVVRLPKTCMGAYELENIHEEFDYTICEEGTLIFKEDFGGNEEDDPIYGQPLTEGIIQGIHFFSTHTWGEEIYNSYDIRKEAIRRSGATNSSHVYDGWYADFGDHTNDGDLTKGYFMQIDLDKESATFYSRKIDQLCENTHLMFSIWGHPVNSGNDATIRLTIEDEEGYTLSESEFVIDHSLNQWQKFELPFSVPLGYSTVVYKVYSSADSNGGDFALDDIEVRLCKPAVKVDAPEGKICRGSNVTLTASYDKAELGGYVAPVEYTWYKSTNEDAYALEDYKVVALGSKLEFESFSSEDEGYYKCIISSNGVKGVMNNCNSASDVIPMFVTDYEEETETIYINEGESVADVVYKSVGVYQTSGIETIYKGCDKKVNYIIYVHPLLTEFYVTTSGRGDHSGRDWDNAMNDIEFATYLPLSKKGSIYHVAEGDYIPFYNSKFEQASKSCYYQINEDVTIIGGYDKDELDESKENDPLKYKTTFTSSISKNNKFTERTDQYHLYEMRLDPETNVGTSDGLFLVSGTAEKVLFDGVRFNYCYGIRGSLKTTDLTLNKCTFEEMTKPVSSVLNLNVDNCYFRKLSIGGAPSTVFAGVGSDMIIRNSTITDMLGGYSNVLVADYLGANAKLFVLENSTIVNNKSASDLIVLPYYGESRIVNNTIVNNTIESGSGSLFESQSRNGEITFVGNLIVANKTIDKMSEVVSVADYTTFEYNLIENVEVESETDLKMVGKCSDFLSGSDATGSFVATLAYDEKGYTPVVALTNNRMSDNTYITFPIEKTTVDKDQRGVDRLKRTCIGAYESGCMPYTITVEDTIIVGESFKEVVYDKVGRYSVTETLKDLNDCDSVVDHRLVVRPDLETKFYYVKINGDGEKTGARWEDAMTAEDFATYFPLVPDGVTFYIAAAVYKPIFNKEGERVTDNSATYFTRSKVNLYGGYPADAKTNALQEPDKYKTIFSGDLKGDDEIGYVKSKETGLDSVVFKNIKDNVDTLLYEDSPECLHDMQTTVSGIVFTGANAGATRFQIPSNCQGGKYNYKSVYVNIEKCTFKRNSGAASLGCESYPRFRASVFSENHDVVKMVDYSCDLFSFDSCTFVNNNYCFEASPAWSGTIRNSTFLNNMYIHGELRYGRYDYSNCTMLGGYMFPKIFKERTGGSTNLVFQFEGNIIDLKYFDTKLLKDLRTGSTENSCPFDFVNTPLSRYNVYLSDPSEVIACWQLDPTDRVVSPNIVYDILDGEYLENGTFVPNLANNGGFTKTIALKADRMKDGTIFRLPSDITNLNKDQRSVARDPEDICYGAYELPKPVCDQMELPKEHKLTFETPSISFDVPYKTDVRVIVTDLQGRLVRDADVTYKNVEGNFTVDMSDLGLFELDHDPRIPFLLTVQVGGKINVAYLYITRLDKNY